MANTGSGLAWNCPHGMHPSQPCAACGRGYPAPVTTINGVEPLNIRQVREVGNTGDANKLLDEGWVLLSVAQDPHGQPWYVLGTDHIGGTS